MTEQDVWQWKGICASPAQHPGLPVPGPSLSHTFITHRQNAAPHHLASLASETSVSPTPM